MTPADIRAKVAAEYETCSDPIQLAAELGISTSKLRGHAKRLGIRRRFVAESFEKRSTTDQHDENRLGMARKENEGIVQTAIAARFDIEVVWPEVVNV